MGILIRVRGLGPVFAAAAALFLAQACGSHEPMPYPHEVAAARDGRPPPPVDVEAARAAAVAGDADALAALGSVPRRAGQHPLDDMDRDLAEAARAGSVASHNLLARRVAEGLAPAQFQYGLLLLEGLPDLGLRPALDAAVSYLVRAAASGSDDARYALCRGYLRGWFLAGQLYEGNVEADRQRAFSTCSTLAATGHTGAMTALGDIHRHGLAGQEEDLLEAYNWYTMASQAVPVPPEALVALGDLHRDSVPGGPSQDAARAVLYYYQALQAGSTDAALRLAQFFETGTGTHRDPASAADVWSRAHSAGLSIGAWGLARAFQCGIGLPASAVEHRYWLDHARAVADSGDDPAGSAFGRLLYESGCEPFAGLGS